mmetsp:Transcript_20615/g.62074  ORF Transcript_20615/g.62074 Transcript_20615/m.62074 type:complete len:530 (-) Transcript_20615:274-1863(-)
MKLDINALRYLSREDFRVLTAVEMGQKNHEIVPVDLITAIAGLKHGGTYRHLNTLLRYKLLHHDRNKYDGYRLTYMGYDFLAIRTLLARGKISAVGRRIGVGKESDVFEVRNEEGQVMALKLHRLGRTSFRAVKNKRDYLKNRSSASFSWLYLSRLAALKEFAFMAALEQRGMPVPRAVDHNRHAVLMSLVDAYPLTQVRELRNPGVVYSSLMDFMAHLARLGLIHCDFNEFNVLVDDEDQITIIDFPQMVSVAHPNAAELFDRDVEGVVRFFTRKLGYVPQHDASLQQLRPDFAALMAEERSSKDALDVELSASGFKEHHQQVLELWRQEAAEAHDDSNATSSSGAASHSDEENSSAHHSADDALVSSQTGGHRRVPDSMESLGESSLSTAHASSPSDHEHSDFRSDSAVNATLTAVDEATVIGSGERDHDPASHSGSELDGHPGPESDDELCSHRSPRQGCHAPSMATSRSSRRPPVQSGVHDVQRRVTASRQGDVRRNIMVHASRNAQKRISRSRRSAVDASMRMG